MDFTAHERDGLILTRDLIPIGVTHRDLVRAVAAGRLVRLRRGAYVPTAAWAELGARERHVLRMRAASRSAGHPLVFARESAAALWNIPLDDFPDEVVVLEQWRGGGRSEPGVRRTTRGATTAGVLTIGEFSCTDVARTVLDLTRTMPFSQAVPLLDWSISSRNAYRIEKRDLTAEAERMRCAPKQWRAIDFADARSGSIGESEARAVIHELGFVAPHLQRRFVDREGEMFSDFHWEGPNVAAEFDGKAKYTREEYTKGDPAEVVWREKKREDRLRRQVRTVVRILTADVRRPAVLATLLRDAGIPRRGSGG